MLRITRHSARFLGSAFRHLKLFLLRALALLMGHTASAPWVSPGVARVRTESSLISQVDLTPDAFFLEHLSRDFGTLVLHGTVWELLYWTQQGVWTSVTHCCIFTLS